MMNCIKNIEGYEPKIFWKNFNKILSIPNPSGHEEQLVNYLKEFSSKLNLDYIIDETGNIIIRKPASKGKENSPVIVLQAHLDMVPQKNQDSKHDFFKDPITAKVENGWVKANGTTLGADNGTGVATIMSILENKELIHGPIEALLTVDEEVGLRGASNLKPGLLSGKYMLNLDSGPDDVFIIGCAGGVNTSITFEYEANPVTDTKKKKFIKLTVKGLKGGHSGGDVQKQLGNANKILFRILYRLNRESNIEISNIDSGGLRNAIPREGTVILGFNSTLEENILGLINTELELIKNELKYSDPEIYITTDDTSLPEYVIDKNTQNNLIAALHTCHNGLIRVFDKSPEFVQTSTNLASVKMNKENKTVKILFMTRSAVLSLKNEFCDKLEALFTLAGAKNIVHDGAYPGWVSNTDSLLLKTAVKLSEKMFGKKPELKIIHGGLECGIIGSLYPDMEIISTGPNITGAHSPEEKLEIASMEKNYNFVVKLLSKL